MFYFPFKSSQICKLRLAILNAQRHCHTKVIHISLSSACIKPSAYFSVYVCTIWHFFLIKSCFICIEHSFEQVFLSAAYVRQITLLHIYIWFCFWTALRCGPGPVFCSIVFCMLSIVHTTLSVYQICIF